MDAALCSPMLGSKMLSGIFAILQLQLDTKRPLLKINIFIFCIQQSRDADLNWLWHEIIIFLFQFVAVTFEKNRCKKGPVMCDYSQHLLQCLRDAVCVCVIVY